MSCGCEGRKERLNAAVPGFGDQVELFLKPIAPVVNKFTKEYGTMTEILKPDMKSLVWLAIGAFVVPYVLRLVK